MKSRYQLRLQIHLKRISAFLQTNFCYNDLQPVTEGTFIVNAAAAIGDVSAAASTAAIKVDSVPATTTEAISVLVFANSTATVAICAALLLFLPASSAASAVAFAVASAAADSYAATAAVADFDPSTDSAAALLFLLVGVLVLKSTKTNFYLSFK